MATNEGNLVFFEHDDIIVDGMSHGITMGAYAWTRTVQDNFRPLFCYEMVVGWLAAAAVAAAAGVVTSSLHDIIIVIKRKFPTVDREYVAFIFYWNHTEMAFSKYRGFIWNARLVITSAVSRIPHVFRLISPFRAFVFHLFNVFRVTYTCSTLVKFMACKYTGTHQSGAAYTAIFDTQITKITPSHTYKASTKPIEIQQPLILDQ